MALESYYGLPAGQKKNPVGVASPRLSMKPGDTGYWNVLERLGVASTKNPVRRRTTARPTTAREYSQPPYDEMKPSTREAYNAGLEAGAEDRHVPATKAEEIERVQSQAWQFLQGHRFSQKEGTALAAQFATGYREGMSGKYTATANPISHTGVSLPDAQRLKKIGKWIIGTYDDHGERRLYVTDGWITDYPREYGDGRISYDSPEAIPASVKKVVSAHFSGESPLHRSWHTATANPHHSDDSIEQASAAAASMYAKFHGRESGETLRFHEEEEYEADLAVLGTMVELKVATLTRKDVVIDFTNCNVVLAANESGDQLYFVGGDQSLDLKAMAFTGDKANKTLVAIGTAYELTYRTEKGFDKFKLTDYYHEIGEETGFQPILTYDSLNRTLSIVGGEYKVKPEGIVN